MLIAGCGKSPEAMLQSAKTLLAGKDRPGAVIELMNALQKDPNLAEARFLLGKAKFEMGELPAAEKELRKAAELEYPQDEVIPLLARVLVAQGEYKKALDDFGKTTLKTPAAKADLHTSMGLANLALKNTAVANDRFETALVFVPDFPPALLAKARMKAVAGDIDGALALVDTVMKKAPALAEGWKFKGDLLGSQNRSKDALAAYGKAVDADPQNLAARLMIVSFLIQEGNFDDAGKDLERAQKMAPNHPETTYLQALLAYRQQNYAAARDAMQQHLKVAPDNPEGLLLSARINYQMGAYTQAEAELRTVLQKFPEQRLARRTLIQTYLRMNQPGKALDTAKPLLEAKDLDGDTLTLIGEVYAQNGDMAKASKFVEMSVALDPNNPTRRTTLALSHLGTKGAQGFRELEEAAAADTGMRADIVLIVGYVRNKRFGDALAAVAALEKKHPDNPLVYNLRGLVLQAKGDTAGARRSFEQAVAKNPAFFPAAGHLAQMDLADKKPDQARKRFETVLAKDPKNVLALLALAGLRADAGASSEEVANLIGQAVAADPTNAMTRLALIGHYLRNKEPKLAVTAAQEALNALPNQPELLDAAGRAYWAAGDANQALTTYGKLLQIVPTSPLALMRMAELQIATKDNAAARETLKKLLAFKPNLIDAQRLLVVLDVDSSSTKEALEIVHDMQKQRPKESVGYMLEGDLRAREKSWGEAAAAYRNGLKQAGTADLAVRLHIALVEGGNSAEADKVMAAWLKDHPADTTFRAYLAEVAMEKQDYANAAKYYRLILEKQPNDASALNNLAWVLGQLKDPKALEYAEKAAKLAPDAPFVLDTLGSLLLDAGDLKRGVELLKRAVSLAPNIPGIRFNLARGLLMDNQKEAAKTQLDALEKLGVEYPRHAAVKKMKEGL